MLWKNHGLALAALLAGLAVALCAGCSKYDSLERNMQYVSNDLLRQDAVTAWETATAAHDRWRKAGGGREAGNAAFEAYQDAFLKYAIVYNELLERQNASMTSKLRAVTDEVPPPPPGTAPAASRKPAPTDAPPATPQPQTRQLNDATPARPLEKAAQPKAATPAGAAPRADAALAGGDRYVVASGDTLHLIAKRHGVSEKSLMEANGITDPKKLAAGKALTIPAQ